MIVSNVEKGGKPDSETRSFAVFAALLIPGWKTSPIKAKGMIFISPELTKPNVLIIIGCFCILENEDLLIRFFVSSVNGRCKETISAFWNMSSNEDNL